MPPWAMRMRDAGTGLSTPRSEMWVSDSASPQLGRCTITEGAASASPAGVRSHSRDATFTQCPMWSSPSIRITSPAFTPERMETVRRDGAALR